MMDIIIKNLSILEYPVLAFMFCWSANFIASIYYNVGLIKDIFDKKRLIDGAIKMISVGLAMIFLSIGATILIAYAKQINLPIDPDTLDGINILSMVVIFAKATIEYAKQGYSTIQDIVSFKKSNK